MLNKDFEDVFRIKEIPLDTNNSLQEVLDFLYKMCLQDERDKICEELSDDFSKFNCNPFKSIFKEGTKILNSISVSEKAFASLGSLSKNISYEKVELIDVFKYIPGFGNSLKNECSNYLAENVINEIEIKGIKKMNSKYIIIIEDVVFINSNSNKKIIRIYTDGIQVKSVLHKDFVDELNDEIINLFKL